MPRLSRVGPRDGSGRQQQFLQAAQNLQLSRTDNSLESRDPTQRDQQQQQQLKRDDSTAKVLKYLDDFRSASDTKALFEEGYEVDYDRLIGVGKNSAVFLARQIAPSQQPITNIATAGPSTGGGNNNTQQQTGNNKILGSGEIAVKVIAKKWISTRRPLKTRTGNLKLALALGQTKVENNILHVIDVFKTTERIFIFMQYCAYGNVISFIRRNGQVSMKLTQRWSSQMASALSFLHKFHVAHRNYKLENVLIDDNLNAKLTGFGLSKFCIDLLSKQPVMSRTICGSEPYLAPEMLKESRDRLYDPKLADVWAFGVGLFLCSTRRYPFEADNLRSLRVEQLAQKYLERDTKHRLRSVVRDLLAQIFITEPSRRPTMQDLINSNKWLNVPQIPVTGAFNASQQPIIRQQQQQQQQQTVPRVSPARQAESPSPTLDIARSPQLPEATYQRRQVAAPRNEATTTTTARNHQVLPAGNSVGYTRGKTQQRGRDQEMDQRRQQKLAVRSKYLRKQPKRSPAPQSPPPDLDYNKSNMASRASDMSHVTSGFQNLQLGGKTLVAAPDEDESVDVNSTRSPLRPDAMTTKLATVVPVAYPAKSPIFKPKTTIHDPEREDDN